MPPLKQETTTWRSLGELAGSEEFKKHLETEHPGLDDESDPSGVSRRRFMQLMGASVALAGMQACRYETQKIVPFASRPEDRIPGVAKRFATAMERGGVGMPLLVTSHDGRPTKIEGNPQHPAAMGASDAFAQASILELCDPERSKRPLKLTGDDAGVRSWADFHAEADAILAASKGLAVVAEASSSEMVANLRARLESKHPGLMWVTHEPAALGNAAAGSTLAFGAPHRSHYSLKDARVILCVEADAFGLFPDSLRLSREWADRRAPEGAWMNRLYAVESAFSQTGGCADHRLALRAGRIPSFLAALERRVAGAGEGPAPTEDAAAKSFLDALADDLKANAGAAVVIAGDGLQAEAHAAVHRLNAALGAVGAGVRYTAEEQVRGAAMADLVTAMKNGAVDTLLVLGATNPAYSTPAALGFADAMKKVTNKIHFGLYEDETAQLADWHLPAAHFLESWGDCRAWDGSRLVAQPLIEPLYEGRSLPEFLAGLLGERDARGADLFETTLTMDGRRSAADLRKAVRDGALADGAPADATPALRGAGATPALQPVAVAAADGDLELAIVPSAKLWDGRYANNSWLQELPDFMSKLCWDNALMMSPKTAEARGIEHGDLVEIDAGGRKLVCAVYVMPGQATGALTLEMGYGRTAAGVVGGTLRDELAEPVGFDAFKLLDAEGRTLIPGVKVTKTGGHHRLATTQEHHAIDTMAMEGIETRLDDLVRSTDLAEFKKHPDFAQHQVHHPPLISTFEDHDYSKGHQWGMAIDLNRCTGCSACVIACQSENNIPVVGKADVLRGREMHWIRIDRYFASAHQENGEVDYENPRVTPQPVACQHCEKAPCEPVCPVAATVHSDEGLNDMVYNRCVGTRYCSNNCPYKVRRFNFFHYNGDLQDPKNESRKIGMNPEVTVRSRGVMEKCTFCVQRLKAGSRKAKLEKRPLKDGEIQVACQQACPTEAIVFGDLNDPSSAVRKQHENPRAYALLEELNIHPRNLFLAKVRNPNPVLG